MDGLLLLRTIGALGLVLGALVGGLWLFRRTGFLSRRAGDFGGVQRLEVVERTSIDPRRSVFLIRRDGREHLLVVGPEGTAVVESGIIRDEHDEQVATDRRLEADARRSEAEERLRHAQARLHAMAERAGRRILSTARVLRLVVGHCRDAVQQRLKSDWQWGSSASFHAALARSLAGLTSGSTHPKESQM